MRKQSFVFILTLLSTCGFSFALQALNNNANQNQSQANDNQYIQQRRDRQIEDRQGTENDAQRKDAIMERDEVDDTDAYAIPLDSSEIEDEEEVNRLTEQKQFKILDR